MVVMKNIFILLSFFFISPLAFGQIKEEKRALEFDSTDLKIIQRADSILTDRSKWNKQDDRLCEDDIAEEKYSLFCALYKASIDVSGEYIHRRPAIQAVRFTLEKYESGRVKDHRLMDWNNHADTTFEEVKMVLKESTDVVERDLKK